MLKKLLKTAFAMLVLSSSPAVADELSEFEKICFPDLAELEKPYQTAIARGWVKAELSDHKILPIADNNKIGPDDETQKLLFSFTAPYTYPKTGSHFSGVWSIDHIG